MAKGAADVRGLKKRSVKMAVVSKSKQRNRAVRMNQSTVVGCDTVLVGWKRRKERGHTRQWKVWPSMSELCCTSRSHELLDASNMGTFKGFNLQAINKNTKQFGHLFFLVYQAQCMWRSLCTVALFTGLELATACYDEVTGLL